MLVPAALASHGFPYFFPSQPQTGSLGCKEHALAIGRGRHTPKPEVHWPSGRSQYSSLLQELLSRHFLKPSVVVVVEVVVVVAGAQAPR